MLKSFLLVTLLISFISFGQNQKIRAYLDDKQFYDPEVGCYAEVQLQFIGVSIQYKAVDQGLMGEIAVRLSVSLNDSIVASDAYRLQTPLMKDSIIEDFYDLKRFVLKPGTYELAIELQDLNAEGLPVKAKKPLYIEAVPDGPFISDIQISESVRKEEGNSVFNKSGYEIMPHISTYYSSEISNLPLYLEIYNSKQLSESEFAVKQAIINQLNGVELTDLTLYTRHRSAEVLPIIRPVDISTVPSGKYVLEISILTRDMEVVSTKSYEFERVNDVQRDFDPTTMVIDPAFQLSIPDDSVRYYLASLIPISGPIEVKSILAILKAKDDQLARKHMQAYWVVTADRDYYQSWLRYKSQVQLVERIYASNYMSGFETDRGRVYLQYGAPTSIVKKDVNPAEYPYEIWQYNKISKYSNKRFVFYDPDLVNNGYRLLHSDMVGELKNPAWQYTLNKRNTTNGNVDNPNAHVDQTVGGNSEYYYRQY